MYVNQLIMYLDVVTYYIVCTQNTNAAINKHKLSMEAKQLTE